MSVEKYLENVKFTEVNPGPFSVRLKYNLKNYCYEQRRKRDIFLRTSSKLALVMLVLASAMIYKPDLAANLHENLLCKTGILSNDLAEEEQLIAERRQAEIDLPDEGRYLGMWHAVSTGGNAGNLPYGIMGLSELTEEKPYIIRKVRDRNNRYIYIVNEVEEKDFTRNTLY
jgi:hypothetical protein